MTLVELGERSAAAPVVLHPGSFVSERLGFVYQCVPKALSRSMLQYLATVDPDGYRLFQRDAGPEVLDAAPGRATPKSFTFVRNPYSRAVAVYFDKFANYRASPAQKAMFARYEGIRPDMTLSAFVEWLASSEGSDRDADLHFLSQHYYLLDDSGDLAIDYVGRVETAAEDFATIQRHLGLPLEPLPHVNSNATRARRRFDTSNRWEELLDDRSRRLLTARYDGDFELLGYPRLPFKTVPLFSRKAGGFVAKPTRIHRIGVLVNRLLAPLGVELRRTSRSRARRWRAGARR